MHHLCICDQKSASHRISVSFVVPCSTEMGKKINLAEYRNRFIIIVFSKQKIVGGKKLYFFCLNKRDSLSSVIAALAFHGSVTAMQLCLANMLSLSQKKGDNDLITEVTFLQRPTLKQSNPQTTSSHPCLQIWAGFRIYPKIFSHSPTVSVPYETFRRKLRKTHSYLTTEI